MKLLNKNRAAAVLLAAGMTAALAGCGATANTATAETATSESVTEEAATSESATGESAADAYAYLADYDFAAPYDENGGLADVKVSDYVTLAEGYDAITLPADLNEVSDAEIDDYIAENVLASFTTTQQVTDRAAEDGDSVNIDYVGSIDGVEFEGGSSKAAGDSGYDLTLGSGSFIDDFEDQIVGHMPGDSFDVTVTFPDPYTKNPDYSGKEAVFKTELHYINEEVTPELTDAWVQENLQEFMGFADVAELKSFVKDTMLFDKKASDVYSALLENTTFADELPQELKDYYRDISLYSVYLKASQYGMGVADLLSVSGYDSVDAYLAESVNAIEGGVKQMLLMQAVAEDKDIVADTATTTENFHRYYGTTDPSSYFAQYGENYVKATMLQSLVMQSLMDGASYTG